MFIFSIKILNGKMATETVRKKTKEIQKKEHTENKMKRICSLVNFKEIFPFKVNFRWAVIMITAYVVALLHWSVFSEGEGRGAESFSFFAGTWINVRIAWLDLMDGQMVALAVTWHLTVVGLHARVFRVHHLPAKAQKHSFTYSR